MSEQEPIAPFELDPSGLDPARLEPFEPPPDHPQPAVIETGSAASADRRGWRRIVLGAAGALIVGLLGVEAYDLISDLLDRSILLGGLFGACLVILTVAAAGAVGRELWSLRRLADIEDLRARSRPLLASEAHGRAEAVLDEVARACRGRPEITNAIQRFEEQAGDALSDGERLRLFSQLVLAPIDRGAQRLVVRAARDIGVLTALSPLGLLDGVIVLGRTLSMLRAIARIYGIRPGYGTSITLLRRALINVLAAGVGELIGDAAVETAGAGLLGVLSAKAGQGAVNGLLAARLGLTAMQLCRPLPFAEDEVPSIKQLRSELLSRTAVADSVQRPDPG
jgi:putative membrane protein